MKKLLIRTTAENELLEMKLQKMAIIDEHYARLYGPTVLISQNKVDAIMKPENVVVEALSRRFDIRGITKKDSTTIRNNRDSEDLLQRQVSSGKTQLRIIQRTLNIIL